MFAYRINDESLNLLVCFEYKPHVALGQTTRRYAIPAKIADVISTEFYVLDKTQLV